MNRSTPLKRTGFTSKPERVRSEGPTAEREVKPNRCKHCRQRLPADQARHVLHADCIDPWLAAQRAKKERKQRAEQRARATVERADVKRRKAALKRIPDLIKEAQIEFNKFIRERDRLAGHACISSGKPLDWSGNEVDAGHYRSVGAAPHLRFDERNCHAQSKRDNQYRAGNAVDYRIGLIARRGLAEVEALEADNHTHKWQREELIAIKNEYRAKLKELMKRTT